MENIIVGVFDNMLIDQSLDFVQIYFNNTFAFANSHHKVSLEFI